MRKTTAVLAAIALLAGLSACSASDTVAGCTPSVPTGDVAKTVKAAGKFDSEPKVTFPTPLYTKTSEQATLIDGHGPAMQSGQPAVVEVTILNGTDGSVLTKTTYGKNGGTLLSAGSSTFPALTKAMICAQVGSRIAVVASPKDGHQGKADSTNGIAKNDSFVYVIDVKQKFLAKANGGSPAAVNGLPTVVTTKNGTPGLVFPGTAAPKKATTAVVQTGSGAAVKKTDIVIAHLTGVSWESKPTQFQNTWKDNQPSVIQLGGQSISAGLSKAILGKKVGSQLLVVLPAKDAAVGDGSGGVPAGKTVVYVVDILGIVK